MVLELALLQEGGASVQVAICEVIKKISSNHFISNKKGGRNGSFHDNKHHRPTTVGSSDPETTLTRPSDEQPTPLGFIIPHMSAASITSSTESSAGSILNLFETPVWSFFWILFS